MAAPMDVYYSNYKAIYNSARNGFYTLISTIRRFRGLPWSRMSISPEISTKAANRELDKMRFPSSLLFFSFLFFSFLFFFFSSSSVNRKQSSKNRSGQSMMCVMSHSVLSQIDAWCTAWVIDTPHLAMMDMQVWAVLWCLIHSIRP